MAEVPEYIPQIEYVPASELHTGVYQPMLALEPEELEARRADIKEHGVQVPCGPASCRT